MSARGSAFVEVVVIVAVVLALGAAAAATLGRADEAQAAREAACIQSFDCGAVTTRSSAPLATQLGVSSGPGFGAAPPVAGNMVDPTFWNKAVRQGGHFLLGIGDGILSLVETVGTIAFATSIPGIVYYAGEGASNPALDTVLTLGKLVAYAAIPELTRVTGEDPVGDLVLAVVNRTVASWNDDPARTLGRGVFEIVTLVGPGLAGKIVSGAAETAELAKAAEIAKAAEVAKAAEIAKAADAADAAKVARAAEEVRIAEEARLAEAARLRSATAPLNARDPVGVAPDGTIPVYKPAPFTDPIGGHVPAEPPLGPDTLVYRVQPSSLPMAPHPSEFFDPSAYKLRGDTSWDALYVSTNREELEALRLKQGYFTKGDTIQQVRLGDLLGESGRGSFVLQDTKFNASVLGSDGTGALRRGGYIIARPRVVPVR